MYRIIFLTLILLVACNAKNTNHGEMENESITVTGIAKNGKEGALVLTDNGPYYIQGLETWEESILNKEVEVTGVLRIENADKEDLRTETGEWKSGTEGDRMIIEEAMWKEK